MKQKVLVTGAAGFIGYHVARQLAQQGFTVQGVDNYSDYYDTQLKRDRAALLGEAGVQIVEQDLADGEAFWRTHERFSPRFVVHLAAQAGVRYSLTHPEPYISSNIQGTLSVLEACRRQPVAHLILASSSSVYGMNRVTPYTEDQVTDSPVSLYAATKKSTELLAHSYAQLFAVPATALRFFTVYGPWGRPDMAYFNFTKSILAGKPIEVFNSGNVARDFTYVDDIVESIRRLLERPPGGAAGSPGQCPKEGTKNFQVFNIGAGKSVTVMEMILVLEDLLKCKAKIELKPMQPGDMERTLSDTQRLQSWVDFQPQVSIEEGLTRFVDWYRSYYRVKPGERLS